LGARSGSRNSKEKGAETCSGASSSIFASIFIRLCACRALVAFARKRLMKDSRCARSRCCFSYWDAAILVEPVEPEAWVEAAGIGALDQQMFVARAVGRSMEPTIHDGDLLVFRANPAGTCQKGKTCLCPP